MSSSFINTILADKMATNRFIKIKIILLKVTYFF